MLTGFDKYGTFRSGSTLNRGQAAAMLARAVDPTLREHYTTERFDLCKDVLGLEHDAPAATINGVDITANQFSYAFAVGRTVENALDFLAEQSAAVDLAVKEGYAPTDDEIAAVREKASERDGFAGLDADAWFYELSQTAAVEYVYKVFIERYGDDSGSHYTSGGNSRLTVRIGPGWASAEIQNHLDKLDMNEVSKRFAASPIGSTYVVSRPMLVGNVSTRLPV